MNAPETACVEFQRERPGSGVNPSGLDIPEKLGGRPDTHVLVKEEEKE